MTVGELYYSHIGLGYSSWDCSRPGPWPVPASRLSYCKACNPCVTPAAAARWQCRVADAWVHSTAANNISLVVDAGHDSVELQW